MEYILKKLLLKTKLFKNITLYKHLVYISDNKINIV